MIAAVLMILLGGYLALGLLFAVPFAIFGASKIDPHAGPGSVGFRILIIPGCAALWPLLLKRWLSGTGAPPAERNSHRLAAGNTPTQHRTKASDPA